MRKLQTTIKSSQHAGEFFNWLVMLSITLFAINNWWLKYEFHNWLTGKLSDVLFCFFFPLYFSAILSIVTQWKIRTRVWCGIGVTLIPFLAMKTSPFISTEISNVLSIISQAIIGRDSTNIVDHSDILAAPMVIFSLKFALQQEKDHS